jgi:hypothetical protein
MDGHYINIEGSSPLETCHIGFIMLDIPPPMNYLSVYLRPQQKNAPVAQWIERQPPELKAAGSNPAGRTK